MGIPHFSGAQLHLGIPVTPETLRPGDLLAYGPDGADHVTMYIGDGLVVEAKGRAYGVIVSQARVDPLKGFAGATRLVP
jgi:cell wall-associated NlpC family hydrolase